MLVGAVNVEAVRVRIHFRIAQHGQQRDRNHRPAGNEIALDRHVIQGDARNARHDRLVAQAFLRRLLLQAIRIGAKRTPLLGMLQKLEQRHAHSVARRVRAREDEAHHLRADLALGHVAGRCRGGDIVRQEVATRIGAAVRQQLVDIGVERHEAFLDLGAAFDFDETDGLGRIRNPLHEYRQVRPRNAENVGDDAGGDLRREFGDVVEGSLAEALVDQFSGDGGRLRPHGVHQLERKGARDRLPAALVNLAVGEQHHLRDEIEDRTVEHALQKLALGLQLSRLSADDLLDRPRPQRQHHVAEPDRHLHQRARLAPRIEHVVARSLGRVLPEIDQGNVVVALEGCGIGHGRLRCGVA